MTQESALNILKLGHSVFLTGGAGSGKTHVLNQYIDWLQSHKIEVAITASTGIASTHIGGTTIHSWSGIGIRDYLSEYDIDELEQKKNLYSRYTQTKVLIIDEISMLHASRLDMVDTLARGIRKDTRPFGGMQVVFCGDFFQLPPITRGENNASKDFAFNAKVWKELNPVICYLSSEHRQAGDLLGDILRNVRAGTVEDSAYEMLLSASANLEKITHTKLFTHNIDVDRINNDEYSKITGPEKIFEMTHKGKRSFVESLMQNCLAPEMLRLKVGTRVMFIKNDIARRYSNGTLGIVKSFDQSGFPVIETNNKSTVVAIADAWRIEEDGKILAEIKQLPLRYAWAITVHKSQGMTLDAAEIDLSKSFSYGMGYVALSRVRTIKGLNVVGMHENALALDPEVSIFDVQLKAKSDRAEAAVEKYSGDELLAMQNTFITKSGGSLEKVSKVARKEKEPTKIITKKLIEEKLELKEIATKRQLTVGTIISHIEDLVKDGVLLDIGYMVRSIPHYKSIQTVFTKHPESTLTELMKELEAKKIKTTFDDLRLVRASKL